MAKLKFQPDPTFELSVSLPIAGQVECADAVFTVKYLSGSQVDSLFSLKERGEDEQLEFADFKDFAHQVVTGWDIDKEFNINNLNKLMDNYPTLSAALFDQYFAEYYKAARKN